MRQVISKNQGHIEEYLLALTWEHIVFRDIFVSIEEIPIKSLDAIKEKPVLNHAIMYIHQIYTSNRCPRRSLGFRIHLGSRFVLGWLESRKSELPKSRVLLGDPGKVQAMTEALTGVFSTLC